MNKTYQSELDC